MTLLGIGGYHVCRVQEASTHMDPNRKGLIRVGKPTGMGPARQKLEMLPARRVGAPQKWGQHGQARGYPSSLRRPGRPGGAWERPRSSTLAVAHPKELTMVLILSLIQTLILQMVGNRVLCGRAKLRAS